MRFIKESRGKRDCYFWSRGIVLRGETAGEDKKSENQQAQRVPAGHPCCLISAFQSRGSAPWSQVYTAKEMAFLGNREVVERCSNSEMG